MSLPNIEKRFVTAWVEHYMFHRSAQVKDKDRQTESEVQGWFGSQGSSKYMDLGRLEQISRWKSGERNVRQHILKNLESDVQAISRTALSNGINERERLPLLCSLSGVSTATASVVLHFAYPGRYPIWDKNVRQALGCLVSQDWDAAIGPRQFDRWSRYVSWMGDRCAEIDVSVRELEKALWQYAICRDRSMDDKGGSSCALFLDF